MPPPYFASVPISTNAITFVSPTLHDLMFCSNRKKYSIKLDPGDYCYDECGRYNPERHSFHDGYYYHVINKKNSSISGWTWQDLLITATEGTKWGKIDDEFFIDVSNMKSEDYSNIKFSIGKVIQTKAEIVGWRNLNYLQDYECIDQYDINQAGTYKIIDIGIHYAENGDPCPEFSKGVFYYLKLLGNDVEVLTWQYFLKKAIKGITIKEDDSIWDEFDLE